MNIKIHVKVNERERERKKELFPFSCNCLFNQWSFLQKKKTKQHKTIFIQKKYMYNVMLHFFFLEKNNKTYQNVYTELRMLVCR